MRDDCCVAAILRGGDSQGVEEWRRERGADEKDECGGTRGRLLDGSILGRRQEGR